ncbi:hypothetical protein BJ508DRAFT_327543 [Ascobolus immersus RN42]|uniref:Mg2+ transporter protein n=1 Tax=Ascobolus immersus RN42 TaxID=1160509 RepID=A0A3N4I297_ASCIM|nr:hypothetical protein BJ508DRAFT_327543 [Ascobolus immersus RN42]
MLLTAIEVSPGFAATIHRQPGSVPPGSFVTYKKETLYSVEFFCQQGLERKYGGEPCLAYMNYHAGSNATTYIVISDCPEVPQTVDRIKRQLIDMFALQSSSDEHEINPFIIHGMLAKEYTTGFNNSLHTIRHFLFEPLEDVQRVLVKPDRAALARLTGNLHRLSESIDTLLSRLEFAMMALDSMAIAHAQMFNVIREAHDSGTCNHILSMGCAQKQKDTISYLSITLTTLKRKLETYQMARSNAMTLVFNLVTQLDAATNMTIAKATREDSMVMKTIAVLTMVFLPATFASSLFGMSFFQTEEALNGVGMKWWVYVVVAFPLTMLTFGGWFGWMYWPALKRLFERIIHNSHSQKTDK